METFTPDDTTFYETVELPEDVVDQRAAASVRVGLEAALDNTHVLRRRFEELEDGQETSWNATGTVGTQLDTHLDSSTTHEVLETGGTDRFESHALGSIDNDNIFVTACFGQAVVNCACQFRLRVTYSDGDGGTVDETIAAIEITGETSVIKRPLVLHGGHTLAQINPEATTVKAYITVTNSLTGAAVGVYLYGVATITIHRMRWST